MTTSWLLAGLGLLCADSPRLELRRADVLRRSGRLSRPVGAAQRSGLADWLVRRAELGGGPAALLAGLGAATALAVAVGATVGVPVGLAVGVLVATTLVLARDVRRHRVASAARASLLSAVRLMVAELEAGARPASALRAGAEICSYYAVELDAAAAAAARADGTVALATGELAPIGHAFAVATQTGAPLAGVLGRVADDLEHAQARALRLSALTAGARASAAMLAGLPLLGLLLGASIGAHPLSMLLTSRLGQLLCGAGVAFDAIGVLWTRRILARAVVP